MSDKAENRWDVADPRSEEGEEEDEEAEERSDRVESDTESEDDLPGSPPPRSEQRPVTRKRSHEEMNAASEEPQESSTTVVGDVDPENKTAVKLPEASQIVAACTQDRSMPPPPVPASSMLPSSQKPPRSGQGSVDMQSQLLTSEDAAQRAATQQIQDTSDEIDASDADPESGIEDFDWTDLEKRYHDEITRLEKAEGDIMIDFRNLCNYFAIWADTGSTKEVDRSFKRLKTQQKLVQHHESELEQKRQHYIQVVNAFKSALELLAR